MDVYICYKATEKGYDVYDLSTLNSFDKDGYVGYYIPSHHLSNKAGIVFEHMIVAEELLERDLNPGEVVHHKDRNRKNNSVNNLMVFKTNSDHSAYHAGCDIKLEGDVYVAIRTHKKDMCPICGKQKFAVASICRDCYNADNAKHIPSKEELCELLMKYNMVQIGKMFCVSDNTIRKWCKKRGLPYKHKNIIDI